MTEGTTRLLETPERPASFHQNVYEHPGGLAQATNRLPPQASPTSRGLETNRKPTNWVLISSIIVAAIALILTGLFITLRNRPATVVSPPVVTRPDAPPVQPPPPPLPPQSTTGGSGISSALMYPGAKTTMEVTDASEGNVLQLETSDSFDKVVKWYTEKLKPTKVVRIPGSNVILEAGEIKAIINVEDNGTSIMLVQGED